MKRADRCDNGRGIASAGRLEWLVLLVALAAVVAAAGTVTHSSPSGVPTTVVKTRSGDTPWGLASVHPVEGLTTAQTADLIVELNGLDARPLLAGSSIRVPVREIEQSLVMR